MKMPEVREALNNIALDLAKLSLKIKVLADETRKRPAHRKVEPHSAPMTDKLADKIHQFAKDNPTMSQFQIAQRFKVNQGRVSEALRGKRT